MLSYNWIRVVHFWQKKKKGTGKMCMISKSTWCWCILSLVILTLITLIEMVSSGFLCCKVIGFPFVQIDKYLPHLFIISYNMPLILRGILIPKLLKCKRVSVLKVITVSQEGEGRENRPRAWQEGRSDGPPEWQNPGGWEAPEVWGCVGPHHVLLRGGTCVE